MFLTPDGRCTVCCFHGGEMTGLVLGIWGFPKRRDGLQFEPHNTGDVDRRARTLLWPSPPRRPPYRDAELLTPHAAVSPPVSL